MKLETIKSIIELNNKNFVIPKYQRGYRWQEQQVGDLLDDILKFEQQGNNFYCLQPLVVKKGGHSEEFEEFIVLDGQQRLTTIFLILKVLEEILEEKCLFKIEYETRKGSKEFLDNIKNKTKDESGVNIDFWHIYKAFLCIQKFFKDNSECKETFKTKFLKHTKIIWYEIDSNENEIELFTRINSGKIPLTNAELIRALLLKNENNQDKWWQFETALELDLMEKELHNDDFWYFLSNDNSYTRMDLIFDLLAKNKNYTQEKNDSYFSFRAIDDVIKNNKITKDKIWKETKEIFRILKEWFDDRECFHKIGFLLAGSNQSAEKLSKFLEEYKKQTKSNFKEFLNIKIKEILKTEKPIENLEYSKDNALIKKILLLFNIQSLLNNKNSQTKFNFRDFKNEKWDIEHIHSQNESIESHFVEWLRMQLVYGLNNERIKEKLDGNKKGEFENIKNKAIDAKVRDKVLQNLDEWHKTLLKIN